MKTTDQPLLRIALTKESYNDCFPIMVKRNYCTKPLLFTLRETVLTDK